MNCTICGKPIVLIPSAAERAQKHGGKASDYTNLFRQHPECAVSKREADTVALMRRLNAEARERGRAVWRTPWPLTPS